MPLTFYLIIGRYYVIMSFLGTVPGRVLARDSLCTARVKVYPDGARDILVSDRAIWHEDGLESAEENVRRYRIDKGGSDIPRAVRRARSAVRDIALCTEFTHFVTLTLDAGMIDRYDMGEIVRKLNRWLDNRVRRDGLAYVLVPERHKDGAVHFHGFFNAALVMEWSGTMIPPSGGKPRRVAAQRRPERLSEGWRDVYNLPAWTFLGLYDRYCALGRLQARCGLCVQVHRQGHGRQGRREMVLFRGCVRASGGRAVRFGYSRGGGMGGCV